MAKTNLNEYSFTELDDALSKINEHGSICTKNVYSRIDDYVHTGNYLLNAQISGSLFKGIPNSRCVALAGEQGTGKTFLSLNACREAQKKGYYIIYCDSESAVEEETFVKFGVDPNKVRYQPINTPHEFRHLVVNLTENLKKVKKEGKIPPKIMIVLDSLGNLATTKEREDALSGSVKKDMTKQQELRSLFRVITMDLAAAKIPLILTAHVYSSINSFISQDIMSGGGGPLYNASAILFLYKSQLKDDVPKKLGEVDIKSTGIIVRSVTKKNRFARPIQIKFHISFYKGMNPFVGLESFISWKNCGIERGIIITEAQYKKETKDFQEKYKDNEFKVDKKSGYFIPKTTARSFVVKHLGTTIQASKLFTPEVFTEDILKELDEKVIRPTFELPKANDIYELEDFTDSLIEDSEKENNENEN